MKYFSFKKILNLAILSVLIFTIPVLIIKINNQQFLQKSDSEEGACFYMARNNYRDEHPNGIYNLGMIVLNLNPSESGAVPYKIKYVNIQFLGFPGGTFEYNCGNYELRKID